MVVFPIGSSGVVFLSGLLQPAVLFRPAVTSPCAPQCVWSEQAFSLGGTPSGSGFPIPPAGDVYVVTCLAIILLGLAAWTALLGRVRLQSPRLSGFFAPLVPWPFRIRSGGEVKAVG